MSESICLFGDRVIVLPIENSDINPGGQVYTGAPKTDFSDRFGRHEQLCMGRIAFVGNGTRHRKTGKRIPLSVKPGQYITFSDSCHVPVKVMGKEYRLLKECDIMTVSDSPDEHVSLVYHDEPENVVNVNRLQEKGYG